MSETITPYSCLSPASLDSLLYYASRAPRGPIVEIGVYKGGSAWHLAKVAFARGVSLHLFDTFGGMPKAGALDFANPVGKFSDTSAAEVQALIPDAILHPGTFPETLSQDIDGVGFVHADADNYEVTRDILTAMPKRMVRGGLILFDDFMVPGCEGCTQALNESSHRILVVAETGKALVIV